MPRKDDEDVDNGDDDEDYDIGNDDEDDGGGNDDEEDDDNGEGSAVDRGRLNRLGAPPVKVKFARPQKNVYTGCAAE